MDFNDMMRLQKSLAETAERLRGPERQMIDAARAARESMRPQFDAARDLATATRMAADREQWLSHSVLRELHERQRLADEMQLRAADHKVLESFRQTMQQELNHAESLSRIMQQERAQAELLRETMRRERSVVEPLRHAVESYRPAIESIRSMVDQERFAMDSMRRTMEAERSAALSFHRMVEQQRPAADPLRRLMEQEAKLLTPLRTWHEQYATHAQWRNELADRVAAVAAAVPLDDLPVSCGQDGTIVGGTTYTVEDLAQIVEEHVFGKTGILTVPLEQVAEYVRKLPTAVAWLVKEMIKHYLLVVLVCFLTLGTGLEPEVVARRLAHSRKTEIRQIMRELPALRHDATFGMVNTEHLDVHIAPRQRSQRTASLAYPQAVEILQFRQKKRWTLVQWADADGSTHQGWVLGRYILRGIESPRSESTENE